MTKYYKTTIRVEVLSNEPIENHELNVIHYRITEGDCSGKIFAQDSVEITRDEMERQCYRQGSDPNFLMPEEELWEREEKQ